MLKKSEISKRFKLESQIHSGITIDTLLLLFQTYKRDIRRLTKHGKYFDTPRTRHFRRQSFIVATPHLSAKATFHDCWFEYINGVHYFHEQISGIHWCRNKIDNQTHSVGSYDLGPLLGVGAYPYKHVRATVDKIAKLYARTHC